MSAIETNKLTPQKTLTINDDYVTPAGKKRGKLNVMAARALTIFFLFATIFSEVVIPTDELWDIFCIYPRDNYSRDNFSYSSFEQQHFIPVLTIPGIADLSLG